ncbi:(d)CMP kinase [Alicyclobacillus ferrooxydans]|uniref:Cytidylate kinase n=1 Tax=Alicyclobacillus ferrooxydans TaxID=471514 RepID=A0A0P9EKC9_9BACL|nr:(d)CMP kinase [Alicyclobacillus ferrooxydans]KPV43552.1 cytidylate kinase [Alicyclobacillus ferrooxydans]
MEEHISIAVDGPAGAGKSTVARAVAKRLGLLYVDTGAMYRTVAWLAVRFGVKATDENGLVRLLDEYPVEFRRDATEGTLAVFFQGRDITPELRSPDVSAIVSPLSVHPRVRERLTSIQRDLRKNTGVVMDGRDIGTVVMPDADVKVFLTASLNERARRRAEEFALKGHTVEESEIRDSMAERDERDSSRDIAPLRPAMDAHILDSTGKSIDEVVAQILNWVRECAK